MLGRKEEGLSLSHGLLLAALAFFFLPMMGAISFLPSMNYQIIDALFESFSGFTTTGLTIYSSLTDLPKSLLLWRALTQWLGGIGIVMVFLFLYSQLRAHHYTKLADLTTRTKTTVALYQAQGMGDELSGGLKDSVTRVMLIYLVYSILGIFLLWLVGLSLFEAIALTFTALSTGGFTVTDVLPSSAGSLLILSLLMLIGSISFATHHYLFRRQFKKFIYAFEKNVLLIILLVMIVISWLSFPNLQVVVFQLISALTTTGYSISAIALLPHLFIMMMMVAMIIGGSANSTAGGIKVFRCYYLLRGIIWSVEKMVSPRAAVIPLKIHTRKVDVVQMANIGIFCFAYLLLLLVGTALFMLFGYSFFDSSFQMISALGTVGLQTMDLAVLAAPLKVTLIIAMLLGRLEIFPLLILARSAYRSLRFSKA